MSAMVLALLLHGSFGLRSDPNGSMWLEDAVHLAYKGVYHPVLRFGCWDITRFNRSSTYMFMTPDLVQQGQFSVQGNHYYFRAVMAAELEQSDKASLVANMDPNTAHKFEDAYARSMSNFEGFYNSSTKVLAISYPVKGMWKKFELHAFTEGDEQVRGDLTPAESAMLGVWHSPDPFPDKLDAHTRAKVDERGLPQFFREALQCDAALFSLLDLRADKTFKMSGGAGMWSRDGSTLTLRTANAPMTFQISPGGNRLSQNGTPAFIR